MNTKRVVTAAIVLSAMFQPQANAWMHGYSGGGYTHSSTTGGWEHSTTATPHGVSHTSDYGGYEHGTQVGAGGGVAHESDAGGAWHGTAAGPQGAYHASDYGGYTHSTAVGVGGAEHTGYAGTTTTGSYYHQPAVSNYYGSTCGNCGSAGWGAAAAGAAVGAAVGVATGAAIATAAAASPVTYAALPSGCIYQPAIQRYQCGATWLAPAYGANGVYFQAVPPP